MLEPSVATVLLFLLTYVLGAAIGVLWTAFLIRRRARRSTGEGHTRGRREVQRCFIGLSLVSASIIHLVFALSAGSGRFPGGRSCFSYDPQVRSVNGYWRAEGEFIPNRPTSVLVPGLRWPVIFEGEGADWGDEISVGPSKVAVESVSMDGCIRIPKDARLFNQKVTGEVSGKLTYPFLQPGGFVNAVLDVRVPITVSIERPSTFQAFALPLAFIGLWRFLFLLFQAFCGAGMALDEETSATKTMVMGAERSPSGHDRDTRSGSPPMASPPATDAKPTIAEPAATGRPAVPEIKCPDCGATMPYTRAACPNCKRRMVNIGR